MNKVRVGVMRGGLGSEYYVSLKTGGSVLERLPKDRYELHDIFISNAGEWNLDGAPITPAKLPQHIDVVFNALHGEFGEDGKVQKILESLNIPYTGSGAVPSAVGMNKDLAKKYFAQAGVNVPRGVLASRGDAVDEVLGRVRTELHAPYVVKPLTGGSSIGVSYARDEKALVAGIEKSLAYSERALIEEYVEGREITVGVIEGKEDGTAYVMAPLEVLLPMGSVFDYDKKYRDAESSVGPARLTEAERRSLEDAVLRAHHHLGLRHYARYDFIMTPEGPYLLEVNTLPGLGPRSAFARSLEHHGLPMDEFLDYVVSLALEKK